MHSCVVAPNALNCAPTVRQRRTSTNQPRLLRGREANLSERSSNHVVPESGSVFASLQLPELYAVSSIQSAAVRVQSNPPPPVYPSKTAIRILVSRSFNLDTLRQAKVPPDGRLGRVRGHFQGRVRTELRPCRLTLAFDFAFAFDRVL